MGLNCKPDDLAVIVNAFIPENIGRLVKVLYAVDEDFLGLGVIWLIENVGAPSPSIGFDTPQKQGTSPDAWLRPIRDPGDDAVDETLINNPVRHEVTA